MAQKWRTNGIWGHFSIFSPFLGHFCPISGRGPVCFSANFFPFLDCGPFSILCQAAWLATLRWDPDNFCELLLRMYLGTLQWKIADILVTFHRLSHKEKQKTSNVRQNSEHASLHTSGGNDEVLNRFLVYECIALIVVCGFKGFKRRFCADVLSADFWFADFWLADFLLCRFSNQFSSTCWFLRKRCCKGTYKSAQNLQATPQRPNGLARVGTLLHLWFLSRQSVTQ